MEAGGMGLPLVVQQEDTVAAPKRPQHPTESCPYHSKHIWFSNKEAGIKLAGTFTRPRAERHKDTIQVEIMSGLNHLFQPADTGLPQEYGQIETTLAPKALEINSNWIAQKLPRPTE